MDCDRTWSAFIAGYTGTAHARRAATPLAVAPIRGVRFTGDEHQPDEPFDDFFASACDPAVALAALAEARPLPRHYLTVLADQPGLVAAYERGGYCLSYSEALMVCDLAVRRLSRPDPAVMAVRTLAEADWLNAHDPQGLRWITPDNLADPQMTHYAVIVDGLPVARGRNLRLAADHSFVSRIYTAESYRRRGLARALMLRLLADDAARGVEWSALMASPMAVELYAGLGYRTVGVTHIFEPAPGGGPFQ